MTSPPVSDENRPKIEPERFFEKLLNATPDAIVIVDTEGHIRVVNDQAVALFGYPRHEVVGQPIETLIPARFRHGHPAHRNSYQAGARARPMGSAHMALFGLRKDGTEFRAAISLSPVQTDEGPWAITAVRDITTQENQQAALRRANEAAIAANRELEAFSYSVAHDLRAPLRSLDGFSQALLEDYGDKLEEGGRDDLRRVRAAAQRLAQLIDDLLSLSRVTRTELHRSRVDLSELAREITGAHRRSAPTREVELAIEEGLVADADARLMGVALENLLGNAWKFTARKKLAVIWVGAVRKDDETHYFVRDNGAGFDMAYAGKLFTAFQRLHARADFEGTGIGLATVQRIIHRHGGKLWAEGAVDRGATFWFTLPPS